MERSCFLLPQNTYLNVQNVYTLEYKSTILQNCINYLHFPKLNHMARVPLSGPHLQRPGAAKPHCLQFPWVLPEAYELDSMYQENCPRTQQIAREGSSMIMVGARRLGKRGKSSKTKGKKDGLPKFNTVLQINIKATSPVIIPFGTTNLVLTSKTALKHQLQGYL